MKNIKELAEQSGLVLDGEHWFSAIQQADVRNIDLERFAELIRLDETKACAKHYLAIMRDAVEQAVLKERKANANLCEITCCKCMDTAKSIRQRGKK